MASNCKPTWLVLPHEDPKQWARIEATLNRPTPSLSAVNDILTQFAEDTTQQTCHFFTRIPGSIDACVFDFDAFFHHGLPLMLKVALEMPTLFCDTKVPLLLKAQPGSVTLSHRQCACLLAHSVFGSITAEARQVEREKWAFRAAQLFFLEATPSALCVLNYFKHLGTHGIPGGNVIFERRAFPRGRPPWCWDNNEAPLCAVSFAETGAIEECEAELHVDFANKFVGGGCLENDFHMEEILFAIKPELIVSMALCSLMQDEDVIVVTGAQQYSSYTGFANTFTFTGDYNGDRSGPPPVVCAMDALQGCARIQFGQGLILRDLNKARIAFEGHSSVATGNWGCGAFGNDHMLKFLQQWLAASEAGVSKMYYHTFNDKRAKPLSPLAQKMQELTVGQLWKLVKLAAKDCFGPGHKDKFHGLMQTAAEQVCAGGAPWDLREEGPAEHSAQENSLEGQFVLCEGVKMLCLKHCEEQLRLKFPDGKAVWRSLDLITATGLS